MPVSVGLQHAGSFQVSGWPYINAATLNSSEQEFPFNFISSEVTVWNVGSQSLDFYFTTGDTSPFKLPAGKKVTMKVKAGSIFAKSASGTDVKLFVSMTNIPVGLIGTIPTGSYFGPIPDDDGDGVPDWSDTLPMFSTFGAPYPGTNPMPVGSSDLWMEFDDGGGSSLTESGYVPTTLYLSDCQMSFGAEDIEPIMENLTAYYQEDGSEPIPMVIPTPDLSGIVILDRNVDQTVAILVERTTIGDVVVSVNIYFKVHFICIEDTTTTGYDLEGDDSAEFYSYPTDPDDTTLDPDDLGYEFYEET
jgi:hypothetical protein